MHTFRPTTPARLIISPTAGKSGGTCILSATSMTHGFSLAGRISVSRVATGSKSVGKGLGFGQSVSTVVGV
jgi:hypothetical protein